MALAIHGPRRRACNPHSSVRTSAMSCILASVRYMKQKLPEGFELYILSNLAPSPSLFLKPYPTFRLPEGFHTRQHYNLSPSKKNREALKHPPPLALASPHLMRSKVHLPGTFPPRGQQSHLLPSDLPQQQRPGPIKESTLPRHAVHGEGIAPP